jgi:general secretion pathway protein M
VIALGIVMVATLLFILVIDPLLEKIDLLDRQLGATQRAITQLAVVGSDYSMARAQLAEFDERIMAGKGTFSLLSYLEEAASAAQVRDHIAAIQPQASVSSHGYRELTAELRLEGVPFRQLLMVLVKLEDSPHLIQLRRLHVNSRLDTPHRFDASLAVSTHDKE